MQRQRLQSSRDTEWLHLQMDASARHRMRSEVLEANSRCGQLEEALGQLAAEKHAQETEMQALQHRHEGELEVQTKLVHQREELWSSEKQELVQQLMEERHHLLEVMQQQHSSVNPEVGCVREELDALVQRNEAVHAEQMRELYTQFADDTNAFRAQLKALAEQCTGLKEQVRHTQQQQQQGEQALSQRTQRVEELEALVLHLNAERDNQVKSWQEERQWLHQQHEEARKKEGEWRLERQDLVTQLTQEMQTWVEKFEVHLVRDDSQALSPDDSRRLLMEMEVLLRRNDNEVRRLANEVASRDQRLRQLEAERQAVFEKQRLLSIKQRLLEERDSLVVHSDSIGSASKEAAAMAAVVGEQWKPSPGGSGVDVSPMHQRLAVAWESPLARNRHEAAAQMALEQTIQDLKLSAGVPQRLSFGTPTVHPTHTP